MKQHHFTFTSVFLMLTLFLGVFAIHAQPTTEIQKLLASDAASDDNFGFSVSISGDVAIVAAYLDDDNGSESGSAYIYYNDGGTWVQQAKLTASDGAVEDYFGISVSISGDVAIVGAVGDSDNGSSSGSAYIFEKPGSVWTNMNETAKLTASDGAVEDWFGQWVSISGDVAIVGANGDDDNGAISGSAYIFEKPGSSWVDMTQTAKLTASDGAASDQFGFSVSISGDVAIVGAFGDEDNGSQSGSAYIFEKPGSSWANMTQTAKLTASDGAANDIFGWSVSISGNVAIASAHADDDNGTNSGSAYIFEKSGSGWANMTQTAKLTASDGAVEDFFSYSTVCISGEIAIVGANGDDDNGSFSGSAYIFEKPGSGWADMTQTAKLTALDGATDDYFGYSVSISGNVAIVGGLANDDNGSNSGSAYIFGPQLSTCDDFTVNLKDSDGNPLAGGSLEYREGGGSGWQLATEISDGVFCIDTDIVQIGLRMTVSPQILKVPNVPTNTDYTFQMENVTVELKEGGVLTNGGLVNYTSGGWHMFGDTGVTGEDGTGTISMDMLPTIYTFRMKYNGDKELKQEVISPSNNLITFNVADLSSSLVGEERGFQLASYPNPFSGNTTIAFSLEEAQEVNISVYDQTGRLIETLHNGYQTEGNHKITWNANEVNKGVYFVRLSANGKVINKNIVKM